MGVTVSITIMIQAVSDQGFPAVWAAVKLDFVAASWVSF
jgi:hypothetical protein